MDTILKAISKENTNQYKKFMLFIENKKNIVIYGAGGSGNITYNILKEKGCTISYFIDDDIDKLGKCIDGVRTLSLDDISINDDFIIVLCVPSPVFTYKKLINKGFKNVYYLPIMMIVKNFYDTSIIKSEMKKIDAVYSLLGDEKSRKVFSDILMHRITMDFNYFNGIVDEQQYFPSDLFELKSNECFIDGGAYDGTNTLDFIKRTNGQYNFIYMFEPDKLNYKVLLDNLINIDNEKINVYNSGLFLESGTIKFCKNGNSSSFISEDGESEISVVKLDDIIKEHKPTFIKLDIEGSEQDALIGMESIVSNYAPKLAISIYHKPEDLWNIPLQIHEMNYKYKLYIRHYLNNLNETVCYAIEE